MADILIVRGRIAAVGVRLHAPPGTRTIEAAGHYVIPGMWDRHAHVAAGAPTGNALEDYLAHGVLGIRDMGGDADSIFALKMAIETGRRAGPAMFVAGPTLNGEKSADFHVSIQDAAEAAEVVHRLRARGADFIKIHRQTSRQAFQGVRDQARKEGISFGGHVPLAMTWEEAADSGMRTIEHIQTIVENELERNVEPVAATFDAIARLEGRRGDKIFAALARNRTYWTPTLIYYESSWVNDPPDRRQLKQRAYSRMVPLVGRAFNSGVQILAGTDALEGRGDALLQELYRLVLAGLTPRDALAAATTIPRDLTGRGPGRIQTGEEGSLVVLRDNPLADIRNVRSIEMVVLKGRVHQSVPSPAPPPRPGA